MQESQYLRDTRSSFLQSELVNDNASVVATNETISNKTISPSSILPSMIIEFHNSTYSSSLNAAGTARLDELLNQPRMHSETLNEFHTSGAGAKKIKKFQKKVSLESDYNFDLYLERQIRAEAECLNYFGKHLARIIGQYDEDAKLRFNHYQSQDAHVSIPKSRVFSFSNLPRVSPVLGDNVGDAGFLYCCKCFTARPYNWLNSRMFTCKSCQQNQIFNQNEMMALDIKTLLSFAKQTFSNKQYVEFRQYCIDFLETKEQYRVNVSKEIENERKRKQAFDKIFQILQSYGDPIVKFVQCQVYHQLYIDRHIDTDSIYILTVADT